MNSIESNPRRPEPAASFVVFDASSGEIMLTHHLSVAPGAKLPKPGELEQFILEHAAGKISCERSRLACLKVSAADLLPATEYRVDLRKKCLVTVKKRAAGPKTSRP